MYADPQSVTINSVANSLPRISMGDLSGKFRSADGSFVLTISHANSKRNRSVVRLDQTKVGANPLDPTKNLNWSASAYLVLDVPLNGGGFTTTEQQNLIAGLTGLVNGTGFTSKFVGQEA